MINVAIVDDNRIVRLGIKSLITSEEMKVIGEAENGINGVNMALETQPDILLLDLYLPDITGLEVCKRILNKAPDMKIIFVTECRNLATLYRLMQSGARGLIRKGGDFKGYAAIKDVYAGKTYIQPDLAYGLLQYQNQKHKLDQLTNREYEVLIFSLKGTDDKTIARNLNLSPTIVKTTRDSAISKLCLEDVMELETLVDAQPDPEIKPELVHSVMFNEQSAINA